MNKLILTTIFVLVAAGAFAQHATIIDIKGKVEIQLPGKDWVEAKNGTKLPPGSMVSTGFKSTANLAVMGGEALISLKPLTRLGLEELIKSSTGSTTSVKLVSGKVKAEVRPGTPTNTQTFEVKGPNATASVRGTGIDTDGESILVNHGAVDFTNNYGVSRSVLGGEFTSTGGGPSVSPPVAVKAASAPSPIPTGQKEEQAADEEAQTPNTEGTDGGGNGPGDTGNDVAAESSSGGVGAGAPEVEVEVEVALDLDSFAESFGDQMQFSGGGSEPTFDEVLQQVVESVIDEQLVVLTADLTVTIE